MIPIDINIGTEQLNVLAYADDTVLIVKNEIEIRELYCTHRKYCQRVRTTHKRRKNKIYEDGTEKQLKTK